MYKLLFVLVIGIMPSAFSAETEHSQNAAVDGLRRAAVTDEVEETIWTCSMHPQIRLHQPGKCPICHMDLIPVRTNQVATNSRSPELTLSPYAEKLAEVKTSGVERKFIPTELLLNGQMDFDEGSIADVALRFPGRIDKLYVNYTGVVLHRGDHIAEVFSPDLSIMQKEYLLELKSPRQGASKSVREKMHQWGFSDEQIDEIGQRGTVSNLLTVNSPITGTVIEKNVVEGQYFNKEERLFRIADLSRLWLILDVYEMDLPFIHYGQEVEFQTDSQPGRNFSGIISYIGPVLNPKTRTVPVRVNLTNPDGKLKPGMFAKVIVHTVLDENGDIIDDRLAGKWISPMHPEIIRDQAGQCDVCGMDLVPAASLGYSSIPLEKRIAPLVIPATAPLLTGRRAVVYIRTAPGRYEARQVELGPRTGAYYPVYRGLAEGDEVVTAGNMKIDGAMQIAGLPSLTSPANFTADTESIPLDDLYRAVLAVHAPLVKGDAVAAAAALNALRREAERLASDPVRQQQLLAVLPETLPGDIAGLRTVYGRVAEVFSAWSDEPGFALKEVKYHRFHCPMANDNHGGTWFQESADLENPYFGTAMLKCGTEL